MVRKAMETVLRFRVPEGENRPQKEEMKKIFEELEGLRHFLEPENPFTGAYMAIFIKGTICLFYNRNISRFS
jgi:hypothetical protein